jgi:hypothetical protein
MANFLTSPGVSLNEIDNTFISPIPVKVGAAIIGPTVKGPVEIPIVVTSYSDYKNRFGGSFVSGSDTYSYLTSIAAYNYFNNGGNSLLVARIVTGSYTPATSTTIPNYIDATSSSFALETISEGVIMNNSGTLNADGSLVSGSLDNVRWEITNSNTGSGTFNVIIRQGNDRTNKKVVLESFTNVNLDPNSPRFISSVIGDQIISYNSTENQIDIVSGSFPNNSRYVRVKNVTPTPNYLDNSGVAVSAYTASIPQNGWFAPAGLIRGALGSVIRAERKLTSGNRDTLYEANVNPIATFPGSGVVVFGQKTLQKKASALDRVNVRRLLIALKGLHYSSIR